ncbi:MAG: glycosyltransferase [Anaerolineae bacterium]|nr:glycosyltransferase [Anaerolineae bacterium]
MIEQQARSRSGWLMPFNGTGGVWRVAAIQEAGGWNGDTLTEDLDLSYRAQLCGWKAMLLPDVVVPGELPPQLAAYEQQQARWAVGSLQNLIAHGWDVLRSERPFSQRLMALHHLCQYVPQALMLLMLLLAPPLLLNHSLASLSLAPLGLLSLVPPLMYAVTQYRLRDDWPRSLAAFPLLVVLGTGLIWRNTAAMTQALLGVTPGFQRTPKFGDDKKRNHYIQPRQFPWVEGALMLYALLAVWLAAQREPALVPYLLLHALSFAVVAGRHLRDRLLARQQKPHESVRHMS